MENLKEIIYYLFYTKLFSHIFLYLINEIYLNYKSFYFIIILF